MLERQINSDAPPRAVLVQLDFGEGGYTERLAEFELLSDSAGAQALYAST